MQTPIMQQRLAAYRQWKIRVSRAVLELESWLETEGQATADVRERVRHTLLSLDKDRLTIAFVAELSRGKTELINAIFFADYGRRLLPSAAGRTTMCPTELLWDGERNEAYLRLLPIETRAQDIPLAKLKGDAKQWVHYPLHVQDPEQMSSTLREIQQSKTVSMAEATRLGLSIFGLTPDARPSGPQVEIPKWRHAVISFPHQLLKQGLVILDTPGLNALGSEPELTLNMLPAAQAILFVLAADTGVTRSDLEMWQHRLKGFQTGRQRGIIVALNKIDVLWDELQHVPAWEAAVETQRSSTAETLGVPIEVVFPVSAQKALLAKIRGDDSLLRQSALTALESHLSRKMLESKHQLLQAALEADVGELLERNRARVSSQINEIKAQLQELEQLREKSDDVIQHLLGKTRQEQELYLKGVRQFQASREELILETRLSRQALAPETIDALIEKAHRDMLHSWTTQGLSKAMRSLFDELRRTGQAVSSESERIRKIVRTTYQRFSEDLGFALTPPKVFVPMKFRVEIELLVQEVEAFRKSPGMALSDQALVIKRFHEQMVSRARILFDQLRATVDAWVRDALQPLANQIQDHKQMMEKRLENLQRIGRSKDNLQGRIDELQKQYVELAKQLTALRNIYNALHYDPLADDQRTRKPHLVAGSA
ncbi:MAG: dynamin family protein [Chromatiaceae bacterium]